MDYPNYQNKIAGCWTGKCLGGAMGMPYEGVPYQPALNEADLIVQDVPNDDLELQLVWLVALKKYGTALDHAALGNIWLKHIPHGCDEYSVALRNMKRGIMPPASGWKDNFFVDGMGAAIRSEIWAAVFAGNPGAAAHFAALDASVDHWGDGVWAEVYLTVAECLAFENDNIPAVLKQALDVLPQECRLRLALSGVFELHERNISAEAAGEIIRIRYYHHNFTDCVMNLATILFALLWGKSDFVRSVLLAINQGRDTDCTAATVGAFLGIVGGLDAIPGHWREKVADRLVLSPFILDIPGIPLTLTDTVAETLQLHETLSADHKFYPPYVPYVATGKEPSLDRSRWLVLDAAKHDIAKIEVELIETGRCPAELTQCLVDFDDLNLDLSRFADNANQLCLMSVLEIDTTTRPEDIYLSATADVGLRLFMDGKQLMNHHSRLKMLPSFHRAEGGAAFALPLVNGSRHVFQAQLFSCLPPLRCCLMFGTRFNDHLDGFRFTLN